MREIKFRAWDEMGKRYLEEDDGTKDFPVLIAVGLHGLPIGIDKDSFKSDEIIGWNRDHNIILEQYTGLKDKNGKEIYEGDLVTTSNDLEDENLDQWDAKECGIATVSITAEDGVIMVDKDGYRWSWDDPESIYDLKFVEIVGNIHENKC